jgi:hypothetical protein
VTTGRLTLLGGSLLTAVALAQVTAGATTPPPPRSAAEVVNRIWSFDIDGDDRISSEELPERMHSLLARADRNGDGFLNEDEVSTLVRDVQAPNGSSLGPARNKTITLADVVSDLRLPQPKHDLALAMVKNYAVPRNINNPESLGVYELLGRLRELLDAEEYENFAAAAARVPGNRNFGGVVGGISVR